MYRSSVLEECKILLRTLVLFCIIVMPYCEVIHKIITHFVDLMKIAHYVDVIINAKVNVENNGSLKLHRILKKLDQKMKLCNVLNINILLEVPFLDFEERTYKYTTYCVNDKKCSI